MGTAQGKCKIVTLKQLAHCVSTEMRRKFFESTMGYEIDEESVLKHLKRLCIKTQNRLVNLIEFGEMTQSL